MVGFEIVGLVTVLFVRVCVAESSTTFPVAAGNVAVFAPATAGTVNVTLPDVAPLITTEVAAARLNGVALKVTPRQSIQMH